MLSVHSERFAPIYPSIVDKYNFDIVLFGRLNKTCKIALPILYCNTTTAMCQRPGVVFSLMDSDNVMYR